MQQVSREMLFAFFDRFTAAFAGWQPDPSAILAARAAAAAAAAAADVGKGGTGAAPKPRAHLQLVSGCSGGHPRALLAAAVESLERAPRAFATAAAEAAAAIPWQPAATENQEAPAEAAVAQDTPASSPASAALLQAGGLPVLRALCLLVRSAHNRAVLSELGLLSALADLVRELGQKLQSAAAVLAVQQGGDGASSSRRSSSPGPGGSRSSSPVRSPSRAALARAASSGQPQLLVPLLVLLVEALAAVQMYVEQEAAAQQLVATRGSQVGSKAVSHAAQAAAQQAASASAAASAATQTAAAMAPLLARGLPASCCQLLPVLRLLRLHTDTNGQPNEQQAAAATVLLDGVWSLEQQLMRTLLAVCSASAAGTAAALQQQSGTPLQQLVDLVGWPLAEVDRQLPVSIASPGSSGSLAAGQAAAAAAASSQAQQGQEQRQQEQQQQEQQHGEEAADQTGASGSYMRVCCGAGLRPAEQELQLQLLALRVLGAAARSGGSSCLRLLQQQGAFARLTQLLQWAALTFGGDAAPAAAPAAPAPGAEAATAVKAATGPSAGSPLAQLFGVLWGWLAGGSGGTTLALLPLLLQAQLAAFRPTSSEGQVGRAAGGSGGGSGGGSRGGSSQRFHAAAVAALLGSSHGTGSSGVSPVSSSGSEAVGDPGTALQQQVLLFAARLLGREQRLLPLLPAAAGQVAAAAAAAGGGVGSSQALTNLQALRSNGE